MFLWHAIQTIEPKNLKIIKLLSYYPYHALARVRPRFFDQVGHEFMYASSGNKHFFTKSCHHQTYQNYEHPPQTPQNLYFQSHFSVLEID